MRYAVGTNARDGAGRPLRRSRRLTPVAGAVAFVLTLAACGGAEGDSPDERASADGDGSSVELSLVTETSYEDALTQLMEEYTEETGITFNVEFAETEQVQNVTRTQLTSDTAGDLLHLWPGGGNPMSVGLVGPAGFAADLSDLGYAEALPDTVRSLFESDGEVLMVSPGQAIIGGLYNTNIWDELGLDHPTTWDELMDVCAAARDAGYDPIALGIADQVPTQFLPYALVPSTVYAEQPTFAEDRRTGEATFAESGWRLALERYLQLEEQACFSDDPLGTSMDEAVQLVMSGEALMIAAPVVGLPNLEEQYDMADQLGVMALPAVDDPAALHVPAGPSSGWGVNAASDNADEAKAFLEWLSSPENLQVLADGIGLVPVVFDEDVSVDPGFEPLVGYLEEGRTVPFMDQRWPNPEVQQALFSGVQQMFSGDASVDDVLQNMDAAYEEEA